VSLKVGETPVDFLEHNRFVNSVLDRAGDGLWVCLNFGEAPVVFLDEKSGDTGETPSGYRLVSDDGLWTKSWIEIFSKILEHGSRFFERDFCENCGSRIEIFLGILEHGAKLL
jgi:hypothetical protein